MNLTLFAKKINVFVCIQILIVANVIKQMKIYENEKSCESYFEILRMTAKMEKILCSLRSDKDSDFDKMKEENQMCAASKKVSMFFVKLVSYHLPQL